MLVENLPVPADRRVWAEATTLRDHGYQVSVICPKGLHHQETYIQLDRICIYRYALPTNVKKKTKHTQHISEYAVALLMTFWLSLRVLFEQGFDVIHAANPPDLFFLIGLFYRVFGKKYIFDQHDLAPELFQVKFNHRMKLLLTLLLFFEWCSYKVANRIIVTNASQRHFALKRGHCAAHKIFIVRNGPDLNEFQPLPFEQDLKGGRRYLLVYVGVMSIQDGVEYTLYALHRLVHERGRQDVTLALVGDGANLANLRKMAHELQLDEYVHFTGWVDSNQVRRYLTAADIGLSTDPQNGLNDYCTMIKTMEYMAMGKPVVAFDLIETRFSAQDAALYAQANDLQDLTNQIETLLNNEGLRLALGACGRKRIEECLSWQFSQKKLLLAYESLFPSKATALITSPMNSPR